MNKLTTSEVLNRVRARADKGSIFNATGAGDADPIGTLKITKTCDEMGISYNFGSFNEDEICNQNESHIRVSDDSSVSAHIKSISNQESNQNQIISGFPNETGTSAFSPLSEKKNSIIQGSPSEPVKNIGGSLTQPNSDAWGELPLYDATLPFEVRNICLQVFFEPKNKETGKPHWGVKVEINNTSEKCNSNEWESIWSGTLLPEEKATILFGQIAGKGYDNHDPIHAEYIEKSICCVEEHLGKWKLVSILAKHSSKGGRTKNFRPIHLWAFVDMGKGDCSRADVVQKNIWEGKAVVVLGDAYYEIKVKWKPGRDKARYISGRIIYQGYWFNNSSAFTVDMGDADLINPNDYNFS